MVEGVLFPVYATLHALYVPCQQHGAATPRNNLERVFLRGFWEVFSPPPLVHAHRVLIGACTPMACFPDPLCRCRAM